MQVCWNIEPFETFGNSEIETPSEKPAPMEYTGPLCRCGTHRCPGNEIEREHSYLTFLWEQD
jgi:hypothetical protein